MKHITMSDLYGCDLSFKEAAFVLEYIKDFDTRRAAKVAGWHPDTGYQLLKQENITDALSQLQQVKLENCMVDAEWVLMEAVDNHMLARQAGNIGASNKALELVGKLAQVDAFAAKKIELSSDKELAEALKRARGRSQKLQGSDSADGGDVSFM